VNELIRFRPTRRLRPSPPDERGAQILFFTGVRYQRMSEDGHPPAPCASRVARRQDESGVGGGGDRTRRR
jgi:hypothetical protein